MINHIFVDLDGVLADTVGQIAKHCGKEPEEFKAYWARNHPGVYEPHVVLDMDRDELWKSIAEAGSEFWSTIPALTTADSLWYMALRHGPPRSVDILSHPQPNSGCYFGKLRWLFEMFGDEFSRFFFHREKHLLAGPGRVLIDDCDANCQSWVKNGGSAITFPQPWNRLHERAKTDEMRMKYVEDCLDELSRQKRPMLF